MVVARAMGPTERGTPLEILGVHATTAPRRAPSCERSGRRIPAALFSEPGGGNRFRSLLEQHALARSSPRGATTSSQRHPRGTPCRPLGLGVVGEVVRLVAGETPGRVPIGSSAEGQRSTKRHSEHRGRRARHTRRPCKMRRRLKAPHSSRGSMAQISDSTLTGSLWVVSPRRRTIRPTWVSTGRPGSSKATLRTTLAVFRPTPGNFTSWSISEGTRPPWSSTTARAIPRRLRVLARKNPVE
jgi:hypothetical protein